MNRPLRCLILSTLLLLSASRCSPAPSSVDDEAADTGSQALTSGPVYAADCTPTHRAFLEEATRHGRIAANSRAFSECVARSAQERQEGRVGTIRIAPYLRCAGDPGAPNDFMGAMSVARGWNRVYVSCTGSSQGVASTAQNDGLNHDNNESFAFSSWLNAVAVEPFDVALVDQAAGTTWHEATHTHGYGHGDNKSNAQAYAACNNRTLPACAGGAAAGCWHFQANTMPYIIGACLNATLATSRDACRNQVCGPNSMPIISTAGGTDGCECVADPRSFGEGPAPVIFHSSQALSTQVGDLRSGSEVQSGFGLSYGKRWTHGAALPHGLFLLYDSGSGEAEVRNNLRAELKSQPKFSAGWTHFVTLPSGLLITYNRVNGQYAAVRTEPNGAMRTVRTGLLPSGYRFATAVSYDQIFLLDGDGKMLVGRVDSGVLDGIIYRQRTATGFSTRWTHVVSISDRMILFYDKASGDTAVGRIANDGAWTQLRAGLANPGWDTIATTFDGRAVWFDSDTDFMTVSRFLPNGDRSDLWSGKFRHVATAGYKFDLVFSNGNSAPSR